MPRPPARTLLPVAARAVASREVLDLGDRQAIGYMSGVDDALRYAAGETPPFGVEQLLRSAERPALREEMVVETAPHDDDPERTELASVELADSYRDEAVQVRLGDPNRCPDRPRYLTLDGAAALAEALLEVVAAGHARQTARAAQEAELDRILGARA